MTSRSRSTSSRPRAIRSSPSSCATWSARRRRTTTVVDRQLRAETRARRAAVRRRPADFLARLLRGESRSTNRRSIRRSAPAPTRSAGSRPAAISNIERVKDWWGADLPVARGQNNFDIVRYEFYRDRDVGFEGFTAKNYLFREEFTSRTWATRYDFPAMQGRPRQARHLAGRHAVGRAGLVHQYAAREIRRSAAARGADSTRSISNGPTRPSCTAPMSAPFRCSRIPT